MKIRIMSSNIWGNCPKECPISDRDDKLAAIYHHYKPDVIGIQECSPKVRKETKNLFKLAETEYSAVPVDPINSKKNDYTPILYRKSELNLLEFGWHLFDGLNDSGSKSLEWALFQTKKDELRFVVINTHFYWQNTNFGRATRINNSGSLMYYYWQLSEKYSCPVFVTGDFNCTINEPPMKTLMMYGLLSARHTAKKSSPYASHHAYPKFDSAKDTYVDGDMPSEERDDSIDHIFVSGIAPENIKKFVTVTDSYALEASDHCPIFVEAEL